MFQFLVTLLYEKLEQTQFVKTCACLSILPIGMKINVSDKNRTRKNVLLLYKYDTWI